MKQTAAQNAIFHAHDHGHENCIETGLAEAERRAVAAGQRLTANRRAVLEILLGDHRPMGAYDVLEKMTDQDGNQPGPPIAYRALEFLTRLGVVHRIDRLNAFIACSLGQAGDHCLGGDAFLICEQCRRVAELSADMIGQVLQTAADSAGFTVTGATVELMGLCPDCQQSRNPTSGAVA